MVKTMGKAVIGLVVIVVIAVGAFAITGTEIPFGAVPAGQTVVPTVTDTGLLAVPAGGQPYNGDLTVTSNGRDSNDPAVTYTGATVYDIICYERVGDDVRDWEVLDGGDDTASETMTIPIRKTTASDSGITEMWCEIVRETGGAGVLIDKDGIIQANQRIDTCIYEDPNLDQTADWVCRVNVLDISPPNPNIIPTLELRLKFLEQASTANLDQTTASIINIGTGNQENRLRYNIDFVTTSTQNDSGAKALAQVQIAINATDGDDTLYDVNDSRIEVPMGNQVQRIKLSQMTDTELPSKILYKWKYDQATGGLDVASANIINVAKNGDSEVDIPVIIETQFTQLTDALCVDVVTKSML